MTPLENYMRMLAAHDWHYQYSDDYGAYLKGKDEWDAIASLGREVDPKGQIRRDFYNTHFNKGQS